MITNVNTPVDGGMLQKREAVQIEVNKNRYIPVDRSIYGKSDHIRKEMKLAKKEYKKLHKTQKYIDSRNNLVHQILSSRSPKWGGVKLFLAN